MFGLAGLSLQIKIALVGSGRRSEDFRGPILSECRGCFTLQIDRFTMGGVNHRGVTSSKLNHTIRNLSVHIRKQTEINKGFGGLKLEGSTERFRTG